MSQEAIQTLNTLKQSLTKVIRGREDTINLVLTGLVGNGHVLIEDYPGSGKTTLAKTLGQSIDCSGPEEAISGILPFRRIQFTPDLLPSDVIGVNVFDTVKSLFSFRHGPIFAHIVLADEINRTGPKVQAAFLECMAERQVTVDNSTYPLDELFFVLGTQNPLDLAGTYPLPLVQLDRFLLRIPMKYVDSQTELDILKHTDEIQKLVSHVTPVVTRSQILHCRRVAETMVTIDESILKAIVSIVQETRVSPLLQFGASTRAAIMLRKALSAWALIQGRTFVTPDDVKTLAEPVLLHRLRFHPGAGDPREAFQEFLKPHVEKLTVSEIK